MLFKALGWEIEAYKNIIYFNIELQRNLSLFDSFELTTDQNYDQALQEHLKMKNKFLDLLYKRYVKNL